jgi:hypothetical protein
MPESPYLDQVRQMVRDFKTATQQRKTAGESAQQTYQAECEAAEAEFQEQRAEADRQFAQTTAATQNAFNAIKRVDIQPTASKLAFQPPALTDCDPAAEFARSVTRTTEIARKIQDDVRELARVREELRRRRQMLAIAAAIAVVMLVWGIPRAWQAWQAHSHYAAARKALEAKGWGKARNELNQVFAIDKNYKDAQTLFKETYYRPAVIALEAKQWEKARSEAEKLNGIDKNYVVGSI